MPDFLDFMRRATEGPLVSEKDFNLKVLIPNLQRAVANQGIQYDPQDPLAMEEGLPDRLFEAALDFLTHTGLYCASTQRVIPLERGEILGALGRVNAGGRFGEGRERRQLTPRRPGDPAPPWYHVGTGIVASSAEIAHQQVTGYAGIPQASSVSVPALNRVRGMPVIAGSPLEIYAAAESVEIARAALTHASRPGLPILNLISSATSAIGTLGGSHPQFGLRASDGWLIDILAEMRVDFETLNRLSFLGLIGGNVGSTALPILGGYGGGPAGTAVLMTAYVLLGPLLFRGAYHLTGPIHFRHGCSTTRDCLWVFSAVGRTASLKTRYPCIALGYAAGGAGTEAYAYESAAVNLASVLAGYAGVQTVHPGKAVREDGVSPLEAHFNVQVAEAALALAPAEAQPILLRIIERYEPQIEDPPQGKRHQDWHDLERGEPRERGLQFYERVKDELRELGLPC